MRASVQILNKDANSLTNASLARVTAVCLAMGGFSIALIGGLAAGALAEEILTRAIASLFVCYMVGYVLGMVGASVVDEAAQRAADPSAPSRHVVAPVEMGIPVEDHMAGAPAVEIAN